MYIDWLRGIIMVQQSKLFKHELDEPLLVSFGDIDITTSERCFAKVVYT